MAYQVFARKYRPLTFDEILGQDHVVQTLRNAIEQERIAQAYLFVGPRGTGKTTTARILAKALNCSGGPSAHFDPHEDICREIAEGNSLDVLEIDGASNNGVEQVRELRESAKFAPSRGRYKIYYIDEVHMLTTAAFNALLKILEEPPPHVKFIFATTEPNKILPTILSRCQRFDLRPIPTPVIAEHLLHIAREEGVDLDPIAAQAVAKGADGGMRDAQSMLDQLVAFCGDRIEESQVLEIFGFTAHQTVAGLTGALLEHRTVDALNLLHEQTEAGKDLTKLLADVITYLRNLLVFQVDAENAVRDQAPAVAETLREQAGAIDTDRLLDLIDHFAEIDARMKWAPNKKMHLEIGMIKAVQRLQESNLSDVIKVLGGALSEEIMGPGGASPATSKAGSSSTLSPPNSPVANAAPPTAAPVTPPPVLPVASPPPKQSPPRGRASTSTTAVVTPTADPSPSPRDEPASDSDAVELWRQLQHKFPLMLSQAALGGLADGKLIIRFHPNDFARERALSKRLDIESQLTAIAGHPLRLDLTSDDTVPLAPAAAPPRAGLAQAPMTTREDLDAANGIATAPAGGGSPAAPLPEPISEETFYEDALIKKALDIFEAKLEKKTLDPNLK